MRQGISCGLGALITWAFFVSPASAGMAPDPRPGDTLLGKAGGLAYVNDPETVTNPDFTNALAACPNAGGQWRLTGGGFQVTGQDAESSFTVAVSRPLDMLDLYGDDDEDYDDYWDTYTASPVGSVFTSFAICTKSEAIRHKREDPGDHSSGNRSAREHCSKGKVVGGGGFIATSDSFLGSTYPRSESQWRIRVFDTIGGIGGMEIWVICARGMPVSIAEKSVEVPPGEARAVVARCDAGEHVTGGGVNGSRVASDMNLYGSYPIDLGDPDAIPDDGWQGNAYNRSGVPKVLRAYAICTG